MLVYNSRFVGSPILSVQAGGLVARVSSPIIDPDNLKIIGLITTNRPPANILDISSIREYSRYGIVIDSIDELVTRNDVIKIEKVLTLNFALPGKKVITKKGSRLGKVYDFTFDSDSFMVQQLIVDRPLLRNFTESGLTIPRHEIIEITDDKIIIKDEAKTIKARAAKEDFIPNFVNPFRTQEPGFSPTQTKTPDEPNT